MKLVTQGEQLFYFIKNELIDSVRGDGISWNAFIPVLEATGGDQNLVSYFKGAVSVNLMRRLVRFWESQKSLCSNEATYVKVLSKYIGNEVLYGLRDDLRTEFARRVILVESCSQKSIPKSIKKAYAREGNVHKCYLCGYDLDISQTNERAKDFFTLEHLWPSSIGGDSIEENLLPACIECQDVKKNAISWEWFNVHDFMLPTEPSKEALKAIPWSTRIARHYHYALSMCEERRISLKDAFINIGPVQTISYCPTNYPITFFDLRTV